MIPSGQQVLFTRQRHEAKRAGLHYDIRLVHGNVAHSWATKKDIPEPGKAIILWEQPVHDSHYALSERVEIPEGQYGAGVTTLDFVRKARIGEGSDSDKLTFHVGEKEKYLIKKLPDRYGNGAWLFKNLSEHKPTYSEGPDSTFTHLGKSYRVDDAIRIGETKPLKMVDVNRLKWILKYTEVDPRRVESADTSVPVIISNSKYGLAVVDGAHRLVKTIQKGKKVIPSKYIDENELEEIKLNKYIEKSAEILFLYNKK